jgi:hypothetical protein
MSVVDGELAGCCSSDRYLDVNCYGKESMWVLVITW